MPKIAYIDRKFSGSSLAMIEHANTIIETYQAQGYSLTLRQLYYQFVSRDLIPNQVKEYKRLGSVINDARMAGLIDWDAIEDRTRNLQSVGTWDSPDEIVGAVAQQFKLDLWADQPHRVEVWIEKEALAGVFSRVCTELRVPFFSCRGYTSQSEMWAAGRRLMRYRRHLKQVPLILHFGDHDPSGIDMTRDIVDRLALFAGGEIKVDRLALNMPQIEEYEPPPNPAKDTDSRFAQYLDVYGDESWELDALEPDVLAGLVREAVVSVRDKRKWNAAVEREQAHRKTLKAVSDRWVEVEEMFGEEDSDA